jgi:hypothetical protein
VTHFAWSTLDSSLENFRIVGVLATLIVDVELQREDSKERYELSTFLHLEDCKDMKIAAWRDYLNTVFSMVLGSMVEGKAYPLQGI